jgi:signal transduction histidine kinase
MTPDNSSITNDDLLAHYEFLIEISQQLNSTLDLSSLLRKIISAAQKLTNTEAASIMLLDSQTGDLRFEITSNLNARDTEAIVIPMEGSTAGWIVRHGEPRVIEDVSQEPSHYTGVDNHLEFHTRNLLGVPMRAHDRVIGVLQALNKSEGERFTSQDVKTLSALASQAAVAIENARLFQQSDFIAEMVHELRTPLAALQASTSLLLRPNLPQEQHREIIETLRGETQRLIRMTSDFLDLARMESGRTHLDIAPFDLQKLIRESAEVVKMQAAERDIAVEIDCIPGEIEGDRGKIKQVLLNLLTNGVKYNREGGVLRITTEPYQQNGVDGVLIAVHDSGYGISAEDQKNMFQKFYRVADTAGFTQGTGLGLAIAKHIIEAHQGEIWLESEPEVGSTFLIALPIYHQA